MTISTRHDVGKKFYKIEEQLCVGVIKSIRIRTYGKECLIVYEIDFESKHQAEAMGIEESKLADKRYFSSKEEAKEDMIKRIKEI